MSKASAQIPARIQVELGPGRSYAVAFEPLARLGERMRSASITAKGCIVVTDMHVGVLYGENVSNMLTEAGFGVHLITLPAGETTKSSEHLQRVYDEALTYGLERGTPMVALGGGVIGDLAGFAAATLLRGLPLVQVPTTLIAQVDSAIGGKTGVNHAAGKNLIGAFYQPRLVLADPAVLQSLPRREWTSGLAEVVKHSLIADEALFADLERAWDAVLDRHDDAIGGIVPRAALVKVRVVSEDERESGLREILNFGHTFAHAIEKVAGYGTFTHGEAVAAGMRAALHLSKQLAPDLDADRAHALVARIPVPPGLRDLSISSLMEAMKADKKVRGGRIRVVLLERIGRAYVADEVASHAIEEAWRYAQDNVG